MQRHFSSSEELCSYLAKETGDTCLLSFSMGKDSIAAWLQARKFFKRVIPVYLYYIPGIQFIEKSLKYYERFLGEHIYRLPNPPSQRKLIEYIFQPPEHCAVIDQLGLEEWSYADTMDLVRDELDLWDAFCAVGVRAADSPMRRVAIIKHGPIHLENRTFQAVYDWKKADLVREFRASGVKLPIDYRIWGRTWDGLDFRFLFWMKRYLPEDYERVLEVFPLAELELKRMEYRYAYYERKGIPFERYNPERWAA
ncbi:MAG TPA: hypothetical protein VF521_03595 [Pyrinomonadaceae bacterium]|jgi:hypothetical protein